MADKFQMGPRLVVDGEAAFKQAIAGINKDMTVLGSEMNKVTAEYSSNKNSVEALTAKSTLYNKQIDEQKNKVNLMTAALENAKTQYGENSNQVKEWQIKLNNAEAALSKTENSLKDLTGELKKQESAFVSAQKSLTDFSNKCKDTGSKLTSVGSSMTTGLTAPILGAVAGLGVLVNRSLETADSLQQMSDVTGLTTERLQEMKYFGTKLDVELETMTGAQSKLIKAMSAAKDGTKAQSDAFLDLNVSVTDSSGNLRNSNDVFMEAIDALGKMENGTERDAVSLKLFGKSALEMNPLIKAGSAEVAKLTEEAHKNGAVMSGESVQALDSFGDSLEAAKLSIGKAASEVAVALLPSLEKIMPVIVDTVVPAIKGLADGVGDMIDWFDDLSPSAKIAAEMIGGLAVAMGPLLSVSGTVVTGISGITKGLSLASGVMAGGGGLVSAFGALVGPAGIMVIGAVAVAGLVTVLSGLNVEEKEAAKRINELSAASEKSEKAFKKQTNEIDTNGLMIDGLKNKLFALSDKEKKTNAEKATMTQLVAQLNKLVPELSIKIDSQTGKIDLQKSAITAIIAEKKKEIQLMSMQDQMVKDYKIQFEAAEALRLEQVKLTAAKEAYTTAQQNGTLNGNNPVIFALEDETRKVDKLSGIYVNANAVVQGREDAYVDMAVGIVSANEMIMDNTVKATVVDAQELAKQAENAVTHREKLAAEADIRAEQYKTDQAAEVQAVKDYQADIQTATQEHMAQMGGIEAKGIEMSKLTAKEVLANLKLQTEQFLTWNTNMNLLAKKVPEDVLAGLREQGPKYSQVIKDLLTMSPEKLAEFVKGYQANGAAAAKGAIDGVGPLVNDMTKLGSQAGQGFANGLNSKITTVRLAAEAMARAVKGATSQYLRIESPSKVMQGLGAYASEGFAIGLTDNINQIKAASVKMSTAAMPNIDRQYNVAFAGIPNLAARNSPSAPQNRSSAAIGYSTSNLYMDSVLVASSTSKVQYRQGQSQARAMG